MTITKMKHSTIQSAVSFVPIVFFLLGGQMADHASRYKHFIHVNAAVAFMGFEGLSFANVRYAGADHAPRGVFEQITFQ